MGTSATCGGAGSAASGSFRVSVEGAGRPVILIPGAACDGSIFATTVQRFRQEHELHVLELSGFGSCGQRPVPEPPVLGRIGRQLADYIRLQRLVRPCVLGHSLGAFLGFWLASEHPGAVGGLIAVDGVPALGPLLLPGASPAELARRAQRMSEQISAMTQARFTVWLRGQLGTMVTDPREAERLARRAAQSSPAFLARAMYELWTTDLREQTASIAAPVLFITPEGDTAAAVALRQRAVAQLTRIRCCSVRAIAGCRHFIMIDAPERLFAEVAAFLAGL